MKIIIIIITLQQIIINVKGVAPQSARAKTQIGLSAKKAAVKVVDTATKKTKEVIETLGKIHYV